MNRRIFLQTIPTAFLLPSFLHHENGGENFSSDINAQICKAKFDFAEKQKLCSKPIGEVVVEIAKSFLGIDYASDILEAPGEERLIVNLQTLDCVTFYENSLVLARCIKKNTLTFDDYKKELQFVRYRNGVIDGYPSRLHYTSDYFFNNEQKGVLKDISKQIGGVHYKKKINFMSTHVNFYPRLNGNVEHIKAIEKIENKMNERKLYYIPKTRVKQLSKKISTGDILGITTNIEGLDCSHTGIALWQKNELHMIHAPSPGKKVQITDIPLWEYMSKIKRQTGIIVGRPLEPKI